jgi:hypothetical protein
MLHDLSVLSGSSPLVLNADEIISHLVIVQGLCEKLQLDPQGVSFEWEAVSPSIVEKRGP